MFSHPSKGQKSWINPWTNGSFDMMTVLNKAPELTKDIIAHP